MVTRTEGAETALPGGGAAAPKAFAQNPAAPARNDALDALRVAAAGGDCGAKAALGLHLLTRAPGNVQEGLGLLQIAADEGHAGACHVIAILAAAGLIIPQNWHVALDYLQRAAERGQGFARSELALLAREPGTALAIAQGESFAPDFWLRLRRAVDVRTWLTVPQPRVVLADPRIAVAEKFISPAICDWLIERSRPRLKPAQTDDPATGVARYGENRTNSAAEFELADTGVVLHLVRARIAALAGPPTSAMEGSTILHYAEGQQFFPHFDFLNIAEPGYARQVAEYGQRVLTFLIYLNDDFEGGETHFPALDWRHKGRKGDALFFWNIHADGRPHEKTLHAGLPPSRGEKFLFSQWVRGRVA